MATIAKVLQKLQLRSTATPPTSPTGTEPRDVAAIVDGRLHSLHELLPDFESIQPVKSSDITGIRILTQTAVTILRWAACATLPGVTLVVRHSQAVEGTTWFAGTYLEFSPGDAAVPDTAIEEVIARASAIMQQDVPITEVNVSHAQLARKLTSQGDRRSLSLLETSSGESVRCHHLHEFYAIYTSPLTPTTSLCGLASEVEFLRCGAGVVVRLRSLPPFVVNSKMMAACKSAVNWGILRKQSCAGEVNARIARGGPQRFIIQEEDRFDHQVMQCAMQVKAKPQTKVVLIAGPSASGKTTFAAKLGLALKAVGLQPTTLSTDDYYRDTHEATYPKLPNGKADHERVECIRLERLNSDMTRLFSGEVVDTPIFDMVAERPSDKTRQLQMPPNGVLVMEGIFALMPKLTEGVPDNLKFKIFIVPLPPVNITEGEALSNQSVRTLRRISRDFLHRGRAAAASIARLGSVLEGEQRNIFPCLKYADFVFNSFMDHELSILRVHCTPLLENVPPEDPTFPEACKYLQLLGYFYPISDQRLPDTSLLREFIGGSYFEIEKPRARPPDPPSPPLGRLVSVPETASAIRDLVSCADATPTQLFRRSSFVGMKFALENDVSSPIAAFVNGEALPLDFPVSPILRTGYVSPIHPTSAAGHQVSRATIAFMLHVACRKVFPERTVVIPHGFGAQGSRLSTCYFAQFLRDGEEQEGAVAADDVAAILQGMKTLVESDAAITYETVPTTTAVAFFEANAQPLSAALLKTRNLPSVTLAVCEGCKTIYMQPLAPSCHAVLPFDLQPYPGGMVLLFGALGGTSSAPAPLPASMPCLDGFRQRVRHAHDIRCIGDVNRRVAEGGSTDMVQTSRALQNFILLDLASRVRTDGVRVIVVGGPSSGGKSIFCGALSTTLEANGSPTQRLSLDSYYRAGCCPAARQLAPDESLTGWEWDPTAQPWESVDGLLLPQLHSDLAALLSGGTVRPPSGLEGSTHGHNPTELTLPANGVLIIEGLLAMHDGIFDDAALSCKTLRVLVTPMPLVNIDELRFVSNQTLRTLRRIAKEHREKGAGALETLRRWGAVGEGEEKHLLPFLKNVDVLVNSSQPFEVGAIKGIVAPLLQSVPADYSVQYAHAVQLRGLLEWFHEIPGYDIPATTTLGEFVGGSPFD